MPTEIPEELILCMKYEDGVFEKFEKYSDDEKKAFTADLKNVYNAPNKEMAAAELDRFEQVWGKKSPYAIRSWRSNWDELTSFYDFPV